ncbi:MAG TPA: glycosyltransferase [Firmicutes bacterium]|nr:glycosyltransferase [Bacillota bacterium]
MSPEVSIIIPTYNRRDILTVCLSALCCQTFPREEYEVIIVDDGSTDSTGDMVSNLRRCPSSPVTSYIYTAHRGAGAARNTGLGAARGRIVIFIDSDIIVTPDFVRSHVMAHTAPNLIVHGPVIHVAKLPPANRPRAARRRLCDLSTSFFATGNVSLERHWLFDAGLFDEDFTEYGWEDLELGLRLRRLGLRAVRSPGPVGFHLRHSVAAGPLPVGESLSRMMQKERERGHMAVVYYRKHPGLRVRMSTMIFEPFFRFVDLLCLGGWPEWSLTANFVGFLARSRTRPLTTPIIRIMQYYAYVKGIREALEREIYDKLTTTCKKFINR